MVPLNSRYNNILLDYIRVQYVDVCELRIFVIFTVQPPSHESYKMEMRGIGFVSNIN